MADRGFFQKFSRLAAAGKAAAGGKTSSISLEEENRRLRRAVEELSILNDLAIAVGTASDPQEIVHKLVDKLMRAVGAEQATVTLFDERALAAPALGEAAGNGLRRELAQDPAGKTQVRVMASSTELPQYHMNSAFLGWMGLYKKPLVINRPASDERFRGVEWDPSVRNVMSVPLMIQSEMLGALAVYNKRGGGDFNEDDQRLLPIIAMQSAQIMQSARLIRENAGMQEQVRLAYRIQRNLLPLSSPEIRGYDIAGTSLPAQTVGGDYFDYIETSGGDWAICLGDVSGKGLPASLLMANLQATLRGQTLVEASVAERIRRANQLMYRSTDVEKFATLFYGVLDARSHQIAFVNAGHEAGLVFRSSGEVERLETGGLALGVLEDFPYEQRAATLGAGDLLVIHSDGVTDATNPSEEAFGLERLQSRVRELHHEPVATLVEQTVESVRRHTAGAAQLDDITLVALKRTS